MPPDLRAGPAARPAVVWVVSGIAGWIVFGLVGGSTAGPAGETLSWLLAVLVVLALGLPLTVVPAGALPPAWVPVLVAVVGWALANSAGWTLNVNVGGPLTGLATAAAVLISARRSPQRQLALVLATLLGVLVGRLLSAALPTVVGLLVTVGAGLAAFVGARWALAPATPLRPVALLVGGWGGAWVGSWFVTTRLVTPVSVPLGVVVEIVLAMAVGGVVTALVLGEPSWRGAAGRWAGSAAVAVAAGWLVALVMATAAGAGPGATEEYLDVGTTVTLPLAAAAALWPVLRTRSAQQ